MNSGRFQSMYISELQSSEYCSYNIYIYSVVLIVIILHWIHLSSQPCLHLWAQRHGKGTSCSLPPTPEEALLGLATESRSSVTWTRPLADLGWSWLQVFLRCWKSGSQATIWDLHHGWFGASSSNLYPYSMIPLKNHACRHHGLVPIL